MGDTQGIRREVRGAVWPRVNPTVWSQVQTESRYIMRIESQGNKPVCHLATLAALTNAPLRDVVRFACKSAGIRSWNPMARKMRGTWLFWDAAYAAAMHFGNKAIADLLATKPNGAGMPGSLVDDATIPATGRGIVIIRVKSGKTHISPWENGRVFDSNAPLAERLGGEWLKTYLARYTGASVVAVNALPVESDTMIVGGHDDSLGY